VARDLIVDPSGLAHWGGRRCRCAIGRGGMRQEKHEGDGVSPIGAWPMRRLLYRPDRLTPPRSRLAIAAIAPADGWCDAPGDPRYNQPVALPYPASAEQLWREDSVYDLIVPLGYNDDPVVPGAGSAIFLHVARPDWGPTEGCVALALADLLAVLAEADRSSRVIIGSG
jgi:L,D-peptidoglycan transpeptidase YkuD (ErfK/YbiS/YcfS/YnhG family)